jgi:periplasmic protein TonB
MGYQALLFCPDEKLSNVVSQVFTDLDFSVEVVHDPFGAVKRLMARHYDALVVDTENEQNAPLLIKSARNSSLNQGCLAIALVEGQMGVAKAYRIGANLVLTKPINVEQAKGTLRVARGLLRKNAEAATTHAASAPQSAPATKPAPSFTANSTFDQEPPASAPAPRRPEPLAFKASQSVAHSESDPVEVLSAATETGADFDGPLLAETNEPDVSDADVLEVEASTGSRPTPAASASFLPVARDSSVTPREAVDSPTKQAPIAAPSRTSAAAPALAKEITASPADKSDMPAAQKEKDSSSVATQDGSTADDQAAAYVPTFGSFGSGETPLFGASDDEESDGSGGSKKFLFLAAAVLVVAAAGYFGYTKFSAPAATSPSFKAQSGPPTPVPAPAPAKTALTPPAVQSQSSEGPAENNQPEAKAAPTQMAIDPLPDNRKTLPSNPPVLHIAASTEPQPKKAETSPLFVRSGSAAKQPKVPSQDDASAPTLSADAGSADPGNLSGLMSSAPAALPKPVLATATRISQGVSQGLRIKYVDPKYPHAALATHSSGAVEIDAKIDTQGYVKNLKVLKGDPILAQAALEAVRQWRYKPYYLDGAPVEIETQITINFKANQ